MNCSTVFKSKDTDELLNKNNDVLNEIDESHSSEVCKSNYFLCLNSNIITNYINL